MKFKLLGTEIYISFLFIALLTFMLATDRTGLIIPTIFAVIIHEFGHLFTMWTLECSPKEIKFIPTSVQIIRSFSIKPYGETAIAFSGPAASIAVFLALYLIFLNSQSNTVLQFSLLNLIIGLFNLLPVKGLDGGTILLNFISKYFGIEKAERAIKLITLIIGLSLLFFGIYAAIYKNFNLTVFIIALYLIVSVIIKI